MRSSQVVQDRLEPWAMPLTTSPQVPQMPSRQSLSKATASSPFFVSCSFRTSSISRMDISGRMPSTSYSWKSAALRAGLAPDL
jgi:hypothetical protein